MLKTDLSLLIKTILEEQSLILATLGSPKQTHQPQKITIRPLLIKEELLYQCTEQRQGQAFHQNLSQADCNKFLLEHLPHFKQSFLFTSQADYQILVGKKEENIKILKKPASKSPLALSHNRKKEYLLDENQPIPFLIELGIMSTEGKIYPQKRDKFKQINRFLEMVEDVLSHFLNRTQLHIVDFGCGKSYLTFALYYYLKVVRGFEVRLTGIDLKAEVIKYCDQLAEKLAYTGLKFVLGDINEYQYQEQTQLDMVVSLHACDTATDAALERAVRWNAKVILCVPCCQHELFEQVHNDLLEPLLKHGILKERFAALATDAARAQLLETLGYRVQVLEFIDMEHTPKNLLIRAIKKDKIDNAQSAWKSYSNFKQTLHINPSLERRFVNDLPSIL